MRWLRWNVCSHGIGRCSRANARDWTTRNSDRTRRSMSGPEPDAVILTLEPTLRFFAACFRRLAVDWCVAGAVAPNAYRDPRGTGDIDLVVQIDATKFPAVAAALAEE